MVPYALVVGDVSVDRYISGDLSAASADAGFPCVSGAVESARPGGAASIAAHMQALGQTVRLIGASGNDPAKAMLLKVLDENRVTVRLFECPGKRTHVCEHVVVGGHVAMQHDCASGGYTLEEGILQAAGQCLQYSTDVAAVSLLVLADFGKGTLTRSMVQNLIAVAANNRIPVLAITNDEHVEWFRGVTVLQLDIAAALRTLLAEGNVHPGLAHDDPAVVADVAAQQIRGARAWGVVITRGLAGAVTFTDIGIRREKLAPSPYYVATTARAVFAAATAVRLMEGHGIDTFFANRVVALAGAQPGMPPVRRIDVENSMAGTIVTTQTALAYKQHLRAAGQTFAMVVGCFDPLHAGSLDLLLAATGFADALLVAYADDQTAQAVAGEGRASISALRRAYHLTAIRGVSRVFEYSGAALAVVRMFHPDVYVMHESALMYGPVVDADYVASYGGRVEFVKSE